MSADDDIPVMTLDQARRVLVLLGLDRAPGELDAGRSA